jgi:hypothetical protein
VIRSNHQGTKDTKLNGNGRRACDAAGADMPALQKTAYSVHLWDDADMGKVALGKGLEV